MSNLILLTGSGFTINFGGYSDWDIKETIKNQLTDDELKKELSVKPYEQIYQELNSGNSSHSDDNRQKFNEAIDNAYADMDSSITEKSQKFSDDEKNVLRLFLEKFNYVFTLNQDLFLEKVFGYYSLLTNRFSDNFQSIKPFSDLLNGKFEHRDPTHREMKDWLTEPEFQDIFKYFKLHGSYAWKNTDNSNVHVMGVGFSKISKVWNYPLLRTYQYFFN